MHPDDVAEYVAQQVTRLRAEASRHRTLAIGEIELVNRFALYVPVAVRSHAALQPVSTLYGADGRPLRQRHVPDLAQVSERQLVVRFGCDDFDSQPPTAELLDAGRRLLPPGDWPKDPGGQGIVSMHPKYRRPFFCRPLLREYHEHVQHEDDPWDRHREGADLTQIVLALVRDLRRRFILQ